MKRKRADRHPWPRVTRSRYRAWRLDAPLFRGYVSVFWIDQVREPLLLPFLGHHLTIADAGHLWLQLFPDGVPHTLTAMVDERGAIVQWYVDICHAHGQDADGSLWYDDMYLDVVMLPTGELEIIDGEELDDALDRAQVTPDEYAEAWREAIRVRAAIEASNYPLMAVARDVLAELFRQN